MEGSQMRNIFIILIISLVVIGCTPAVKPSFQTFMGKAVFDVDIKTPSKEVVNNVYDAISVRSSSLTKTVTFVPSPLPDVPGAPNIGTRSMGIGFTTFSLPQTTCDGAYAIMSGFDKGVSSSTYGTSDFASYTSCIYPYRDAYRIYLVGSFMSSSEGGLEALMADAIKKGVAKAGAYDNIFAAWFDMIIKKLKNNLPTAKEVEIVMP
jgi:hypothetical protein